MNDHVFKMQTSAKLAVRVCLN